GSRGHDAMMKRSLENAAPLLFFLAAFAGCNPMAPQSTIDSEFRAGLEPNPDSTPTGTSFSNSWPFDALSEAQYSFDTTKIDFTGGVCRLTANDQLDHDNSSTGFGGGTHSSTTWDASGSYLRLSQTGTPTNTAELDASWAPQWAYLIAYYPLDNDWQDAKGTHHLTAQSGATFSSTSKVGSHAGSFDGTNDYATTTAFYPVTGSNERTTCAWVKFSQASLTNTWSRVLIWGDSTGNATNWALNVNAANPSE